MAGGEGDGFSMSQTNEMMRKVVAAFAPTLKVAGYCKQGFRFRREVSVTATCLVNFQSSQWNMGDKGTFTVNLGVYHRDLAALHDVLPVRESPLVQHCAIQQRLGFLMPIARDFWWSIDSKTDLTGLGTEVALAWTKYGNPWLTLNSSLEGARDFLLGRKSYFLAAMASLAMGEREESERLLTKSLDDAPLLNDRIEAWRKLHGL
jgi:hypothetical protein